MKKLSLSKNTAQTNSQIIIYRNKNGEVKLDVRFDGDTVWLTQKMMAALFDCSTDNISLHLKNIFKEAELNEILVTEEYSVTASDGKNYQIKHYNLDAIISVGYRFNDTSPTANARVLLQRSLSKKYPFSLTPQPTPDIFCCCEVIIVTFFP